MVARSIQKSGVHSTSFPRFLNPLQLPLSPVVPHCSVEKLGPEGMRPAQVILGPWAELGLQARPPGPKMQAWPRAALDLVRKMGFTLVRGEATWEGCLVAKSPHPLPCS